jgi:hypothetical protein
MKKIILLLILSLVLSCSKNVDITNVYLWEPKTKDARFFKAEFSDELKDIAKTLIEYGHKVQKQGVGFTSNYNCNIGECEESKKSEHWLFVVIDEKTVDSSKYNNFKKRALYIIDKKLEDILFALKKDYLLHPDNKITGILIGLKWSEKKKLSEMVKVPRFESLDIYIKIKDFIQYQEHKLTLKELLNHSIFVKRIKDNSEIITLYN